MKRSLFLFATLCALRLVGETTTANNVTWHYRVDEGEAVIVSADLGEATYADVPGTLGDLPVRRIYSEVFAGNLQLTGVGLPEELERIEDNAFAGCSNLQSVAIAKPAIGKPNLVYLGDGAFRDCALLSAFTVYGTVGRIGVAAFEGSGLVSLKIESGVGEIGADAFSGCGKLKGWLTIPEGVTNIGASAFEACSSLTAVELPDGLTTLADFAFWNCGKLARLEIPASVTDLGTSVCGLCSALTDIVLPPGLAEIPDMMFLSCSNLVSVSIPEGVTNIGDGAFCECTKLAAIEIPKKVRRIGDGAFAYCAGIETVSVPGQVETLGDYAFTDCTGLTSVTLAEGVKSIGECCFENCVRLTKIRVPDSLESAAPEAFTGCPAYSLGLVRAALGSGAGGGQTVPATNVVIVTNVTVICVQPSAMPEFVRPAGEDAGFVNVITEIRGGVVAVPETWAEEFPAFKATYGDDFTKALGKRNGKKNGDGSDMLVWQDYVAGTDPTDPADRLLATIAVIGDKVKISYSPELDAERTARRTYRYWAKQSLTDAAWTEIAADEAAGWNFFKVSVEMKGE